MDRLALAQALNTYATQIEPEHTRVSRLAATDVSAGSNPPLSGRFDR